VDETAVTLSANHSLWLVSRRILIILVWNRLKCLTCLG